MNAEMKCGSSRSDCICRTIEDEYDQWNTDIECWMGLRGYKCE